jgi:hypothetical protein
MPQAKGFKHVGYIDCKGGGQVVARNVAYVSHVMGPEAATLIDVEDPKNPRLIEILNLPKDKGVRSHKVWRPTNEVSSSDFYWDVRGLIYVIDRLGGLNIVERT